jgi:hypothetical protein
LPKTTGLRQVFRALNNRNYRLFFFGQGVSLIGTWMQTIAQGWLVYRITHSPFLLGMVGFASQLPLLLLTPLAGVLSDRWPRRPVLVVTQSLAMLQALVLACLTLTGLVQVWHIMVLAVFSGAINSFDMPTRQAFTLEMVDRRGPSQCHCPELISLQCLAPDWPIHRGHPHLIGWGRRVLPLEWPQLHCGYCRSAVHAPRSPTGAGLCRGFPN